MIVLHDRYMFIMRHAGINRRNFGVIQMNIKSFTDLLTGIEWTIRVVKTGEKYGRDDCLINDTGTLVEFYDSRYRHTDNGQFVARYYAGTIAGAVGGIDLCGYEEEWSVCAKTIGEIRSWLFDPLFPIVEVI
jgi:hypothetical protein